MILALARCGLIATASTTASTIVFAQGILLDDRGLGIASGGANGGAMLLAPAVMLRVAIKRLSRRPPSGMWLAVSALCCCAAEAVVLLFMIRAVGEHRPSAPQNFRQNFRQTGAMARSSLGSARLGRPGCGRCGRARASGYDRYPTRRLVSGSHGAWNH